MPGLDSRGECALAERFREGGNENLKFSLSQLPKLLSEPSEQAHGSRHQLNERKSHFTETT